MAYNDSDVSIREAPIMNIIKISIMMVVLFFSMSSFTAVAAHSDHGHGDFGNMMNDNMPPGLQNKGMPPGLKKQGKVPHGWTQGEKQGWSHHHKHRHKHHHDFD